MLIHNENSFHQSMQSAVISESPTLQFMGSSDLNSDTYKRTFTQDRYIYIYIYVTPPGPLCHNSSERVSNPGFRFGRRRSNKERQRLQPLASVARAPLFEVRRVRFTHSPYWHTSVTLTPLNLTPIWVMAPMWPPRHGSAPAHRAGREPGTPAREAGALTRNAKGYSL